MQPQVEELGDNRVRLTVEVPGADLKHAVEHAASDLADSVKIPGFRKGKVPMPVLMQRIGRERLYAEAVDSHIGGWFWNAAAQTRIRPVEQPEYGYELPDGDASDWRFTATVAVQPKPDLPDWTTLEVPAAEPDIPATSSSSRRCRSCRRRPPTSRRSTAGRRSPATSLVLDLVDAGRGATRLRRRARRRPARAGARARSRRHERRPDDAPSRSRSRDGETSTVEVDASRRSTRRCCRRSTTTCARRSSEFDTLDELRADLENALREQLADELEGQFRSAAVDTLVSAPASRRTGRSSRCARANC